MNVTAPEPFFADPTTTVFHGDSLKVLKHIPDNSVDSVVTDPPYGLAALPVAKVTAALSAWLSGDRSYIPAGKGFMGESWDRFVPPPALWDEVFRVLKPGGFLLTFAGTRTQDLMGMSVRLSGFLVKDAIAWARGDVFPKTKHTLKPGYEPILMAQKPVEGTIQKNIATHGTGGLNVDAVRTPFRDAADEAETKTKNQHGDFGTHHGGNSVFGDFGSEVRENYNPPGRWPTNLVLSEVTAAELDHANNVTRSSKGKPRSSAAAGDGWGMTKTGQEYNDIGGPSRFFPQFGEDNDTLFYTGRAPVSERPEHDGVKHSTVKPLKLMDWAIRLVTPPGGVVLDPFLGSGTTVEAARLAGFHSIGVEANPEYMPLIAQRIMRSS
jgi:DNA modification methylase